MPATITGIVFNDLNHNGIYDTAEPGIPGVYVYLVSTSSIMETQTDANGNYSFTVTAAGSYTIYETVSQNTSNPPTVFTQPTGFTTSNGPRKISLAITAANITGNTTLTGNNFGHDTNTNPLYCTANMIQFVGDPTEWVTINLVTGTPTTQGNLNPADYVNAIGYNILDNYIYGYDLTTNNIVRIDAAGNIMTLGLPTGLPVTTNQYNTGCFDDAGYFYLYYGGAARMYIIDLRPNSPTYMKLVDSTNNFTEQTSSYGIALVNGTPNVADWVWLPSDAQTGLNSNGFLFGIQTGGVMARVNLDNARVINMTTSGPTYNSSYGALSVDVQDNIYAIANQNGNVYRYTINGTTATGTYFSNTYYDTHNDGAMCRTAQLLIDFGDAPDTGIGNGPGNYNTLLANNGPRHQVVPGLMLGTQITAEEDAYQNSDATGDDLIQGIQDDGLSLPLPVLSLSSTSYQLTVTATNNNNEQAYLYGWVDFNQNGLFEVNEIATTTVPANSGTTTYVLNFTIPTGTNLTEGSTFARLRLTTDALASSTDATGQDTASVGPAGDGEVEDYILNISQLADLQITKSASATTVSVGDTLTYTLTITNNGPDAAQTPLLIDQVPAALKNPQYSIDNGTTWQVGMGSLSIPTLNPNESYVVLVQGTVNQFANGTIANSASISSSTPDPNLSNNSASISTNILDSADLSIIKLATPSTVTTGQTLTYTLAIANAGPATAQNTVLTDTIPPDISNPQFSIDGGATWLPWTGMLNIGNLNAGANLNILIQGIAAADAAHPVINTAEVASDTPDPNLSNNTSTIQTAVTESADLAIIKHSNQSPVLSGSILTYTIQATNYGPSNAQNVVISDPLPSQLNNVQYSANNGVTWDTWTGSYILPTLATAANFNLLIRGTVDPAATGIITNTVKITSDTPDPNINNNTDTDLTPINQAADLSIIKTAESTTGAYGQIITFDLTVQNAGPDTAENVIITDTIPPELGDVTYTLDGSTWQPWTGSLNLGNITPSAQIVIQIKGTVETTEVEMITNTATVTSDTPDDDPTNNSSTIDFPLNDPADLSVTKTANPTTATIGTPLQYTVVVTNNGPETAVYTILTEDLPTELLTPEISLDNGSTWQPYTPEISLGDILNGQSQTVEIRGVVDANIDNDLVTSLVNTATVSSDTPDQYLLNNTTTLSTPLQASADLEVNKALLGNLAPGMPTLYEMTITNHGPATAKGVVLVDAIAAGILNPSYSVDNGTTWQPWSGSLPLQSLAASAIETILIQGTLSPATTSSISNTAMVYSTTPDPNMNNNTATLTSNITPNAALNITKSALPNPAIVGEQLTYTIYVLNEGPAYAHNVVVTDIIPPELTNVLYSTDGINWLPWTGSYTYTTLPVGGARTLLIKGTLNTFRHTTITNTAHAKGDETEDVSDSSAVSVQTLADVAIIKWANVNHVMAGDTLQFSLTINNYGPSIATNVVVTDPVPATLENPQYSLDQLTWQPWEGNYNIGNLPIDGVTVIYIRGLVSTTATNEIINTAQVTSSTPDPNLANNSNSFEVFVQDSADIAITKTANMTSLKPDDTVIYTLNVTNAGPGNATEVLVNDVVTNSLENVQYSLNGSDWLDWSSPYELGDLEAGSSQIIYIRGVVSADASNFIANTATATSNTPDPNPANNIAQNILPVPTLCPEVEQTADLVINKVIKEKTLTLGKPVNYYIDIINKGPDPAANIIVSDVVAGSLNEAQYSEDDGLTWQPWSGNLTIDSLDVGATIQLIIKGIVKSRTATTNTAMVISTTKDPDITNNIATANTSWSKNANLSIIKMACSTHVNPCDELIYTIVVTNTGSDEAENVILKDTIPKELFDAEYSLDDGKTWKKWSNNLRLGNMKHGATRTVLLSCMVRPYASGVITNKAIVTSDTMDTDLENNQSTARVRVC